MSRPEPLSESRLTASVEKLRSEFDRWVEAAMSQGGRALDALRWKSGDRSWTPSVDIVETADEVHVYVDLPGVNPGSVDVSLTGNMLTLKGEKAMVASTAGQSVHVGERPCGPFERSIPLPASVDGDSGQAEAADGVIRFRFTKTSPAKSRQIAIKVGATSTPPAAP